MHSRSNSRTEKTLDNELRFRSTRVVTFSDLDISAPLVDPAPARAGAGSYLGLVGGSVGFEPLDNGGEVGGGRILLSEESSHERHVVLS
ncbi:hypothetical protein [Rhodoplanes elegans]|uniref:hypothetical protein n=1 Tax=Rhodoplanes elegans TaxID=29408 RepID=UPI0011B93D6B|nr:hypothetical protein [Rhodoplanes elegans]